MAEIVTPSRVRLSVYTRIPADPGRYFSEEEIRRSKAYQRPLTYLGMISAAISLIVVVTFIWSQAGRRIIDALNMEAWPLQIVVTMSSLLLVLMLSGIPVGLYRTFVHENKWGFNTQTPAGWVSDLIKSTIIGLVIANVVFLALWFVIRSTDLWWLFGALLLTVFAVILVAIAPVVILPLFNKFEPAEDEQLRDHLRTLASAGGVSVSDVRVMDASKRTRHDNAFFTGLGKTKRLVIFDNMMGWERPLTDVVVAHEVGHWRHRHIVSSIFFGTLTTFLAFVALKFVMEWDAALGWAGASNVEDPVGISLFILAFSTASLVTGLIDTWFSRAHERQADLFALNLTRDPESFARVWRQFSEKDLPDLAPSWLKRIRGTHPPIAERLAMGESWTRSTVEAP
ncbi:MAG: M48 family metallopeptidase [Actinomycetota bacterium]